MCGATAFAAKIEVDEVAQTVQSNPIVANRQLRRALRVGLHQLCRRAEILDNPSAIELQPDACLTATVALPRSHHERQIEARVPRASVEVEPLGPRVLPQWGIRD